MSAIIGTINNDVINSGSGNDTIDGGAGNDRLNAGSGNDLLIYRLSQNIGFSDLYTGGSGIDTVRIILTQAEWASAAVQAEITRYVQHLQTVKTNPTGEVSNGNASDFTFDFGGGTKLTVSMMEKVEVVFNEVPVLTGPTAVLGAGAEDVAYTIHASDLLQGYSDGDGDTLHVSGLTANHGSLHDNGDGTWTFTPDANYSGSVSLSYNVTDGFESTAGNQSFNLVAGTGGETQVNSTTIGDQFQSTVAALADGGWVVTWTSSAQDGSGLGVYSQRFDATGAAVGAETQVNSTTHGNQDHATVAALTDGGYVVTWHSDSSQDGSGYGIYLQRFDANGAAVGAETQVNSTTFSDQEVPNVAAFADGGWVVAWTSAYQDGSGSGAYSQRFDASGAPVGAETQINSTTLNHQVVPTIATLVEGGYVATWTSYGQDGSGTGIYSQRFDGNGAPVGAETQVNSTTANDQWQPAVAALTDGGYVVTWYSDGQDGSGYGIYSQRFDAGGAPAGSETQVNSTTDDNQFLPTVATLADGDYVVTWISLNQDGSGYGIYAQRFDANGAAVGAETQVNSTTADHQVYSTVAALADGGYVVTWTSWGQDGSGPGIYSQRFDADGGAAPLHVLVPNTGPITGTENDDTLIGTAGGDTIVGLGGSDLIDGGTADDSLDGGDGDDTLIGGAGTDFLIGGEGNDIFRWGVGDHGTVAIPDNDTIASLQGPLPNDKLDLRDVLVGESHSGIDPGNLADYLHFNVSAGNTTIDVKTQGGGGVDLQIMILGFDATQGGSLVGDNAIIGSLFAGSRLLTD